MSIDAWIDRIMDADQRSAALTELTHARSQQALRADLAGAGRIAALAESLLDQLDETDQHRTALFLYSYAPDIERWQTGLNRIVAAAQRDDISAMQRHLLLLSIVPTPTYLPYWRQAQPHWISGLYAIYAAHRDNASVAETIRSTFLAHDLPFQPPPDPRPADARRRACINCGAPVEADAGYRIGGVGQYVACSMSCAEAYGHKNGIANPFDLRYW